MCQSFSYVISRRFLARHGGRGTVLFGLSHTIMGIISLALLPFFWSSRAANVASYIYPLLGAASAYLVGQFCLFQAFKHTDASRVSPLLGLKIPMLALITVLFLRDPITPLQWVAIFISLVAAAGLNYTGGRVPGKALLLVLATGFGYCLSDICIVALTRRMAPDGSLRMILLSVCLTYCLCGVVGGVIVGLSERENRTAEKWRMALPVAATWMPAMIFLFISFWSVNVLLGNIVQSLRGPFSVILGGVIAWLGHVHLEKRVTRWVLARRLAAAFLMCVAIALFAREKARMARETGEDADAPPALQSIRTIEARQGDSLLTQRRGGAKNETAQYCDTLE